MIILDTNVVSALMSRTADVAVVGWLNGQPAESIWITAISVFEIHFGLELLSKGRRRRQLEEAFVRALDEELDNRVLPFETNAAREAALIAARQRQAGRSMEVRDVQIAGIAVARHASLATRDTRHFAGLDISLVNPWALG